MKFSPISNSNSFSAFEKLNKGLLTVGKTQLSFFFLQENYIYTDFLVMTLLSFIAFFLYQATTVSCCHFSESKVSQHLVN